MLKKLIFAALFSGISHAALASDYYVVVPIPGRNLTNVLSVTLNPVKPTAGMVQQPYSYDFSAALQVTGDPNYPSEAPSWRISSGVAPAGLSLSSAGVLYGTPTAIGEQSVNITVNYKTKSGNQTYILTVDDMLTPTLGAFSVPTGAVGQAAFWLTPPTSASSGAFTFTSSNPSIASVSGGYITPVAPGTTQITATQAPSGAYKAASSVATLTVITPTVHTIDLVAGQSFTLPAHATNANLGYRMLADYNSVSGVLIRSDGNYWVANCGVCSAQSGGFNSGSGLIGGYSYTFNTSNTLTYLRLTATY